MNEREMAERNLIYKVKVGSHLYGCNTSESDTDYVGVFIPDEDYVLGLFRYEENCSSTNSSDKSRNTKDDIDCVLYSLPKFIQLASGCNPNIVEIFFAPDNCIEYINDFGQKLKDSYKLFISKKAKHTFSGYAYSQKQKILTKRQRMFELKDILNHLDKLKINHERLPEDIYVPVSEGKHPNRCYHVGTPLEDVERICIEEIEKYGSRAEYIKKWGFDVKYSSHLFRLMYEGAQILREGKLEFPLPEDTRNLILDIKNGKYSLDEVLKLADDEEAKLKDLYEADFVQYAPDLGAIIIFKNRC